MKGLEWKSHLPNLLHEMIEGHPSPGPLVMAAKITRKILAKMVERAAQIDDPELNVRMLQLALYDIAPADTDDAITEQWSRNTAPDLAAIVIAQATEIERLRLHLALITGDADGMLDALAAHGDAEFVECDAEVLCGDARCNSCGCLVMKRDRIAEALAILGETP